MSSVPWSIERDGVEVAHEALIRYWPRLIRWLEDDRSALLLRETLREAAQEWERNGRDDSYLAHRGRRLDEALALREHPRIGLNIREQAYLDACAAARLREWQAAEATRAARERLRLRIAIGLGLALVVAIVLGAYAAVSGFRATESSLRNLALLASAQHLGGDHERGALLALQAHRDRDAERVPVSVPEIDPALGLLLGADHFAHILRGHQGGVLGIAFDEAGERLVSAGDDGTIRLWDARDPARPPEVLRAAHRSGANVVAFQPGRPLIGSGGDDRIVLLQDPSAPDAAITLEHDKAVRAIAFDPDRNLLATAGREGCLRIWNLDRPEKPVCTVPVHGGAPIRTLAFHPNQPHLFSADTKGNIFAWDVSVATSDGALRALPVARHAEPPAIWELAFSPSGSRLASAGADGTIRLWNPDEPGSDPTVLGTYLGFLRSVAFSPDEQWLASGGDDGLVRLWRVDAPGSAPRVLQGHRGGVKAVAFDPAGRWLASAGADGTVRLWELRDPTAALDAPQPVTAIAVGPDGYRIAAALGEKGTIQVRDLRTPKTVLVDVGDLGERVIDLVFDAEGQRLAAGGVNGTVQLWTLDGAAATRHDLFGRHDDRVTDVAFSQDDRWLVSSGVDESVRVWDTTRLHLPAATAIGDPQGVNAAAFDPAGQWLAATGSEGNIAVWTDPADLAADADYAFRAHEGRATILRIDPQRRWLVSAGHDGAIKLWPLEQIARAAAGPPPTPQYELFDHDGAITAIAFSDDGDTLVSASTDGTVRLWNLNLARPEVASRVLISDELKITALGFRADGQLIVVDDDVHLWDTSLQALAGAVCDRVWRNLTQDEWVQFFGARDYEATCENHPSLAAVVSAT